MGNTSSQLVDEHMSSDVGADVATPDAGQAHRRDNTASEVHVSTKPKKRPVGRRSNHGIKPKKTPGEPSPPPSPSAGNNAAAGAQLLLEASQNALAESDEIVASPPRIRRKRKGASSIAGRPTEEAKNDGTQTAELSQRQHTKTCPGAKRVEPAIMGEEAASMKPTQQKRKRASSAVKVPQPLVMEDQVKTVERIVRNHKRASSGAKRPEAGDTDEQVEAAEPIPRKGQRVTLKVVISELEYEEEIKLVQPSKKRPRKQYKQRSSSPANREIEPEPAPEQVTRPVLGSPFQPMKPTRRVSLASIQPSAQAEPEIPETQEDVVQKDAQEVTRIAKKRRLKNKSITVMQHDHERQREEQNDEKPVREKPVAQQQPAQASKPARKKKRVSKFVPLTQETLGQVAAAHKPPTPDIPPFQEDDYNAGGEVRIGGWLATQKIPSPVAKRLSRKKVKDSPSEKDADPAPKVSKGRRATDVEKSTSEDKFRPESAGEDDEEELAKINSNTQRESTAKVKASVSTKKHFKTNTDYDNGPYSIQEKEDADDVFIAWYNQLCIVEAEARQKLQKWSDVHDLRDMLQEKLARRTITSIRKFIQRRYDPYEHGAWTVDQDASLKAGHVATPGRWTCIAATVGRAPMDCRDRWRNHLQYGDARASGAWLEGEEKDLRNAVVDCMAAMTANGETKQPGETSEDLEARLESMIDWNSVASKIDGRRSRKQCLQKWAKLKRRGDEEVHHLNTKTCRPIHADPYVSEMKGNRKDQTALRRFEKMKVGDVATIIREIMIAVEDLDDTYADETTFWSRVSMKNPESVYTSADRRLAYYRGLERLGKDRGSFGRNATMLMRTFMSRLGLEMDDLASFPDLVERTFMTKDQPKRARDEEGLVKTGSPVARARHAEKGVGASPRPLFSSMGTSAAKSKAKASSTRANKKVQKSAERVVESEDENGETARPAPAPGLEPRADKSEPETETELPTAPAYLQPLSDNTSRPVDSPSRSGDGGVVVQLTDADMNWGPGDYSDTSRPSELERTWRRRGDDWVRRSMDPGVQVPSPPVEGAGYDYSDDSEDEGEWEVNEEME